MNTTHYERLIDKLNELATRKGSTANLLREAVTDESERPKFYKTLKKQSIPRADALLEWLENLGAQIVFPGEEFEEFELVRKVSARAGAGSSLITSSTTLAMYAFRKDFLHGQGIHADHAVMMDVLGPSMEPMIMDGDTILVDERDLTLRDGGIYAIGYEEDLLVKCLQRIPGGWTLHSENPSYRDIEITGEELERLRVYGRVRWFGRVL